METLGFPRANEERSDRRERITWKKNEREEEPSNGLTRRGKREREREEKCRATVKEGKLRTKERRRWRNVAILHPRQGRMRVRPCVDPRAATAEGTEGRGAARKREWKSRGPRWE